VVNLDRIAELGVAELTVEALVQHGLLKKRNQLIKVLATGELTTAVTVHAHKFSKAAQEKIEKAGGTVVLIGAS
jgi:large subunit ribosomal protein L15